MAIVVKYRFNPQTYENLLPQFNSGYTSYTVSDVTNHDGTITRTITMPNIITVAATDDFINIIAIIAKPPATHIGPAIRCVLFH